MDLREAQAVVKGLERVRGSDGFHPLTVFAGIREGMSELWQYIAWVPESEKLERARLYREDIEIDIGHLLFLVLKLADQFDVDAASGLRRVLQIYASLNLPPEGRLELGARRTERWRAELSDHRTS